MHSQFHAWIDVSDPDILCKQRPEVDARLDSLKGRSVYLACESNQSIRIGRGIGRTRCALKITLTMMSVP